MAATSRPALIVLALGLALLLVFPALADRYYLQLVTRIMVVAIFAISLDLLVGCAGLVSLGHAAFFGLAGYVLALAQRDLDLVQVWTTLPLALAVTAAVAAVIGWLSVRTSGVYFIMITLAFGQMLYYLFNDHIALGGSDGLFINAKPAVGVGGFELIDLRNRTSYYYFVLGWLIASYLFVVMLLRAPFGRVIAGIRVNEPRTRALGFPTPRYKLVVFVIAGTLAGLAGYLNAAQFGVVNPAHLGWRESGLVLMIVILGGMGTLFGPVLGAFVIVLVETWLEGVTEHWLMAFGAFVVAIVLFLPEGIAGLLLRLSAPKAVPEEAARDG
jgi:branched-chain amino acid transport system permease protein